MKLRWPSIGIACTLLTIGCGSSHHSASRGKYHYYKARHHSASVSHSRLGRLGHFDVPIDVNDRVLAWVDYFTGAGRGWFERSLVRSGRYMTIFRKVLREQGLPEDLVYVALIESGFSNRATSVAAAAGTWQFIQSTGRRYGLGINGWVDQRRDPEMAVVAAARYLKDLHAEFGDWYLAIAGYNGGEGRVRQAIARYGTRDFWALTAPGTNVFRSETRDYVPKFLAAAIVAKSPDQFGFHGIQYQQPWQYELARVDSQTDLQVVADCAGVSVDDVTDLNPDLRSGMTPPGGHEVRLPVGTAKKFQLAFAKVPRDERVRITYHLVERRDTLPHIARRYGVSVREIMAANSLRSARALHRGQQLLIPRVRGRALEASAIEVARRGKAEPRVAAAREGMRPITYRVKRGDSLSGIATRFGVSIADLRIWNNLAGRRAKLLRGQRLRIGATEPVLASANDKDLSERLAVPSETDPSAKPDTTTFVEDTATTLEAAARVNVASYTVRRGDSWGRIAEKLSMSVASLKALNPEIASGTLRIGQQLTTVSAAEPLVKTTPVSTTNDSVEWEGISQAETPSSDAVAITASSTVIPPPTAKAVPIRPKTHLVRSGDTLVEIAGRYGLSVGELQRQNHLQGKSMIRPGQRLVVAEGKPRGTTVAMSDQLAMAPRQGRTERTEKSGGGGGGKHLIHKVRAGDTLWDISRVYNVSPEQIKMWNNLSRPMLKPGQTLTIHIQSRRS